MPLAGGLFPTGNQMSRAFKMLNGKDHGQNLQDLLKNTEREFDERETELQAGVDFFDKEIRLVEERKTQDN